MYRYMSFVFIWEVLFIFNELFVMIFKYIF